MGNVLRIVLVKVVAIVKVKKWYNVQVLLIVWLLLMLVQRLSIVH